MANDLKAGTIDTSSRTYKVSDYGIFQEAYDTTMNMKSSIEECQEKVQECKSKLSDSGVFMGPIADSCTSALEACNAFLTTLSENYSTIANYLIDSSNNYKKGDKEAAKQILSIDENGKISVGTSGITFDENNLQTLTVTDIQSCQSVQEYLDLVMPIYSCYCKKYGIKYPGVLALQPVHEHSAPTGIYAPCAVEDNNLGGLKYGNGIPNATPGTYPGDGSGGQYSHFENFNQYVNGACWNIVNSGYYGGALEAGNMEDFATSLISTWAEDPYYSEVIDEYRQYGLDKYELDV